MTLRAESGSEDGEPPARILSGREGTLGIEVHYWPDDPEHRSRLDGGGRRTAALSAGSDRPHSDHARAALDAARIALRRFKEHGFKDPLAPKDSQGRHRVIIALRNLGMYRGRTSPQRDEVEVERMLRGDALTHTIFHELFHRIQYAYNDFTAFDEIEAAVEADQGRSEPDPEKAILLLPMLREGGARLIEQLMSDGTTRYQDDADSWFAERQTSLVMSVSGRRDALSGGSYEGALFWKYVAEQHGTPVQASATAAPRNPTGGAALARYGRREAETQQKLLRECERVRDAARTGAVRRRVTLDVLRRARARMEGCGHFDRFWWFDVSRDRQPMLGCSETTWGNFLVAVALNGTAGSDTRFRFEDAPGWRGITASRQIIPESRRFVLGDLEEEDALFGSDGSGRLARGYGPETIERQSAEDQRSDAERALAEMMRLRRPIAPERPEHMLAPFSCMAFRVSLPSASHRLVRVRFTPEPGFEDALVQVISLDRNGELVDLYRHDGAAPGPELPRRPMDKIFPTRGIGEIVILVASRVHPGSFRLHLSRTAKLPLLYAASWNGVRSRHITQDPGIATYDWQSPDVIYRTGPVPTQHVGSVDGYFELVVRNRGSEAAVGVTVRGEYASIGAPDTRLEWRALPALWTISTINADEECDQALRLSPQRVTGRTLRNTSCYINLVGQYDPYSRLSTSVFDFGWPKDVSRNGKVLRFTVTAINAPGRIDAPTSSEPLVVLSMADSRPPPLPEGWKG